MSELWQLAARWLSTIGVLPPDDPSLQPDGRVYELAMALQDGTVLCRLVNKIIPGSISDFSEKPEKQFLKMQNINKFLEVCQKKFRMKEGELFTADELYYASNFPKVVASLSALSRTPPVGVAGYGHFPDRSVNNTAHEDGQDVYQSLEELVGQSLSLNAAKTTSSSVFMDEDADEIYGALKQAIAPDSEDVYKDLLYSDEDNIYSVSGLGADDKRSRVMAELYETERNFVNVLNAIANVFQPALSKQPKVISRADTGIIFGNINEILDANNRFLRELEEMMQKSTGRVVGSIFLTHIPHFRCYAAFCRQIPDASAKVQELENKQSAQKLLSEAKQASKQRFGLKDLLSVPMQRILKYPLLIKELIKHTPDVHPDKVQLQHAKKKVEELAKYINDTKQQYDSLKSIMASLRQYSGRPIQDLGPLIKDGDLMFKSTAGKDKMKLRYVFLFANGIVICKSHKSLYTHKLSIDFESKQEIVEVPHWSLPKEEQHSKHSYLWAIKFRKGATEHQHIFAAKTMPLKRQWESAMRKQLSAACDASSAPPAAPARVPTLKPAKNGSHLGSFSDRPLPSTPGVDHGSLPPTPKAQGYMPWVPGGAPMSPETPSPPGDRADVDIASDEAWFAGQMPRNKAEKVLATMPDGAFLVRESDGRPGEYSLSIMFQSVKHIKINRKGTKYNVAPDSEEYPSIQDLVAYFQVHSLKRHFPPLETTLRVPFRHVQADPSGRMKSSSDSIGRARSRFPYAARNNDELSFDRGVELQIISMDEEDEGWWRGRLPTGEEGVFPANYVQRL